MAYESEKETGVISKIHNCSFNYPTRKRKRLSSYQIFLDRGG